MKKVLFLGGITAGVLMAMFLVWFDQDRTAFGSVTQGNEYMSTTTSVGFADAINSVALKSGYGTLGSIIVTGTSSTMTISVYDATTSDATKRTNTATTTLASIPSTLVQGTYTFDTNASYGILVQIGGTKGNGTSTITFR